VVVDDGSRPPRRANRSFCRNVKTQASGSTRGAAALGAASGRPNEAVLQIVPMAALRKHAVDVPADPSSLEL
jgi:hypothetical protein